MDVIAPRINLNGTAPDVLLQQQNDVVAALQQVLGALLQAWPHGRDYQNAAPGQYEAAVQQATGTAAAIDELIRKHTAIGIAIISQGRG